MWYGVYALADEAIARRHAEYFRQNHLPCDVIVFGPSWHTHNRSCSFVWDSGRFPDPRKLVLDLEAGGFKASLWEHLFTHPTAPFYGQLRKCAGDHEVLGGLVPDLAMPEARRAFADHHEEELVDRGVAGFTLEECDSSDSRSRPVPFPDHAAFPSGMDGEQMHSMVGILHQRTLAGIFRKKNRRTVGQAGSSHALAAPLPFVLFSGFSDHRDSFRALANSGFSGLLCSPELRQAESIDDLLRRVQSAVLSPYALVNATQVKNPPWMQFDRERNNRDEFLPDWRAVESVVRRWFELRMSLIPYLYAAMARYWSDGVPPVRALVMEWPDDRNTWNVDDQWLLGDNLLVAPMSRSEKARTVYLPWSGIPGASSRKKRGTGVPNGGWYDFWTHRRYAGGASVKVDAPIDRIPLFVRENTILPLAKPVEFVRRETVFNVTAHVFGETPVPFTLLEDDGWSYDFEKGVFNRLELSWKNGNGEEKRTGGRFTGVKYRLVGWKKAGS